MQLWFPVLVVIAVAGKTVPVKFFGKAARHEILVV